ncbi:MAG: rRNA maturation RNase YbeY [Anaerolineales bacterium]|nr:rRNA maturation RNase YbeY [Anaerolineales bacterium]
MIHLHIESRYRALKLGAAVRKAALVALAQQNSQAAELSVVLTGNVQVRRLNQQFRGVDAATDVLSFGAEQAPAGAGDTYLGDIVISVPRARAQARAAGHSLAAEVQLLTVHGVLHLLGYDHASAAQRRRMWAAQDAILAALRLPMRSAEMETRPEAK